MRSDSGIAFSPAARNIVLGSFITFGALLLWTKLPLRVALTHAANTAAVGALLFGAWGQGTIVMRKTGLALSRWEQINFSIALGVSLMAVEIFILGLAGLWRMPVLFALLVAGGAIAVLEMRKFVAGDDPETRPASRWMTLLLVPHALTFLAACMPPVYYDALVYHCGLPNFYLHEQRWVWLPENLFAAFPQLMEMNFLALMGVGARSGPCLLVWSTSILTLLAAASFARRFLDEGVGWAVMALMSVAPFWLLLSFDAYVDVPLAWFTFLAVYAFCLSCQSAETRRWEIVCGLMAGAAFSVKYTGGITVALLFAGYVSRRRGLLYSSFVLLAASPWLLRNMVTFENPFFPFFYQWVGRIPWSEAVTAYHVKMMTEYGDSFSNLRRILLIPWELAMGTPSMGGGFDLLGNYGWNLPLFFLPTWLLYPIRHRLKMPLFLFLAGYYALWVATKPVSRFLVPLFPVLAVLAAWGALTWYRQAGTAWRYGMSLVVGIIVLFNVVAFQAIQSTSSKLSATVQLQDPDDYLAAKLSHYKACLFLDRQTDVSRICILGDQRTHYIPRRFGSLPVFAENPLIEVLNRSPDSGEVRGFLHEQGFSHILVNDPEWIHLLPYGTLTLNDTGMRNWTAFQADGSVEIYRDSACRVLRL